MLRIRLTRTGKNGQPSYRIVVTEHTSPVKARFIEILGYYNVSRTPRQLEYNEERLRYWLAMGAQPSGTAASLFKTRGLKDMEVFMTPGKRKRKKKKAGDEAPVAALVSAAAQAPAQTPSEDQKPAEEVPADQIPAADSSPEEAAPAA